MRPCHIPDAASEPFETRERCVITELLNTPESPAASLAEARVAPGVITESHALGVDEVYVITQGEGRMELEDRRFAVKAGDAVTIPAGAAQRIENTGAEDLVFLCLCTPRFTPDTYRPLEGDAP
jgi:mannose-6-phosphate isomerase-like protein (cupin superfamily)